MAWAHRAACAWNLPAPDRASDRHDLEALAVLWTRDPAAALSHDSALAAYELGDINPSRYHVTVPVGRRIRKAGGEGYVIHDQHLLPEQVTWWEGKRTVTPLTEGVELHITEGVGLHKTEGVELHKTEGIHKVELHKTEGIHKSEVEGNDSRSP